MFKCKACGDDKPREEFYTRGTTRSLKCKSCEKERGRTDQHRAAALRNYHETRIRVIEYYSDGEMKCACCGESTLEFLAIDHIHGGGNQESIKTNRYSLARRLLRDGLPNGYRVLCHNCNHSYGHYGTCPHQLKDRPKIGVD